MVWSGPWREMNAICAPDGSAEMVMSDDGKPHGWHQRVVSTLPTVSTLILRLGLEMNIINLHNGEVVEVVQAGAADDADEDCG